MSQNSDQEFNIRTLWHMPITSLVRVFGVLLLVGIVGALGINQYALQQAKIGGPKYQRIADGKNLVTDIMPPALYLVEAALEMHLLYESPRKLPKFKRNLARMKAEYLAAFAKLDQSNLPEKITKDISSYSHLHAQKFWSQVEQKLIPALSDGNLLAARIAVSDADKHFRNHRRVILKVVDDATKYLEAVEQRTDTWATRLQTTTVVIAGLVLLSILFLIWTLIKQVSRPLDQVARTMVEISKGEYETEIPYQNRNNEIGHIASSLAVFRDGAVAKLRLEGQAARDREAVDAERKTHEQEVSHAVSAVGEALGRLAKGDLTTRITEDLPARYHQLGEDFNQAVEGLESAVLSVANGTSSISTGTQKIAQASDDLSRRTESQAATLEETAAAIAIVTTSVAQSAEGADRAREVVAQSKQQAENGGAVARRAVEAMEGIENSSREIGDIIGVIDEIAFQTNLLALNAGVEAARAGDAGRGFAVVASEVRALAQRSAKAARQIKVLISTSTGQVDQGVQLVRESGDSLDQIMSGIGEINTVVADIATNAQDQSASLQQVNTAVTQLDHVTQENAAMVEEATAATRTLAIQTKDLQSLVVRFQMTNASDTKQDNHNKTAPIITPHSTSDKAPSVAMHDDANSEIKDLACIATANGSAGAPVTFTHGQPDAGWEEF